MTLDDARAVLKANQDIAEGAFLFALHERDRFDAAAFWTLYNATLILGDVPPEARDAQLRDDAFWVYRNILMSLLWHFHPGDQAHIEALPDDLAAYVARIEWGFHPLIRGQRGYGWSETFGDGLTNPQHAVLTGYFERKGT